MPSTPRWPIRQVDKLIVARLKDDATIKQLQKVSAGDARLSGYRPVPSSKSDFFPYIFFYAIAGVNSRVNGNTVIQWNPDFDFEVRTLGAPTDDDEAVVERVDELITMVSQPTPDGKWLVSSVASHEINITQQGETSEVYYTRIGNSYKFQVVRS
jgi:hypothetical protein